MEEEDEGWFENHYSCPCGEEWVDEWSCCCNDRCPNCNKEIEPHTSVDLETGEETEW